MTWGTFCLFLLKWSSLFWWGIEYTVLELSLKIIKQNPSEKTWSGEIIYQWHELYRRLLRVQPPLFEIRISCLG